MPAPNGGGSPAILTQVWGSTDVHAAEQGPGATLRGFGRSHIKGLASQQEACHCQPQALIVSPLAGVCAPLAGKPPPSLLAGDKGGRTRYSGLSGWALQSSGSLSTPQGTSHVPSPPLGARGIIPACQPPRCPHRLLI